MIESRYRFATLATLCAVLAACLFLPGLGGGFILDDRPVILENGALYVTDLSGEGLRSAAHSFHAGQGSRALAMLSFALDHWRSGWLDPRAFKATNVAIHALTALVLAFFFRRLLLLADWQARRAAWTALAMAALWASHPLQVSAVLYVVQRMQTLGTLFLALALLSYLQARRAQILDQRSRGHVVTALLFWVLAFAAKEDSVLFPAYALVLELTVLRFRAAQPRVAQGLRKGYLLAGLAGLVLYLAVVVPHYWSGSDYPGRTFSSAERLLSQGRVLVMYIGQILLPVPERLPFYYDDLQISRSVLDPITTLPAWILLFGLVALAWSLRDKRPVFTCGVLLFFAGHLITSNVINLEMAFEHRNHFPLIGASMAIGDLCVAVAVRLRLSPLLKGAILAVALLALGAGTVRRAHAWGEPLRFAHYSVETAPLSARAWLALGGAYADLSGLKPDSPYLDKAITICLEGADKIESVSLTANVVNYKTIQGSVEPQDWQRLHERLRRAPMTLQNRNVVWTMIRNARRGIPMDQRGVLDSIAIVSERTGFSPYENLLLAGYAFRTRYPDEAHPYFLRAFRELPAEDPAIIKAVSELNAAGRSEWVAGFSALDKSQPSN